MGRPTSRRLAPALDEPLLPRAERRAAGIYYTPPKVVRELVRMTLDRKPTRRASEGAAQKTLRILDPACGAGAMLAEAARQLAARGWAAETYGMDSDRQAIAVAQSALPAATLWAGDALFDGRLDHFAPFDAIVGNPPYISIRQLAKSLPRKSIDELRERYDTARGNFDLYVPFIQRSLELLRAGGRCGLVIPNKWATLDYARPLRELLLAETSIEHVVDLSSVRVFAEASVYPHLLVFEKRPAARVHAVRYHVGGASSTLPQRLLSSEAICFADGLEVESRVETMPLEKFAVISCGTPGYSARRVAESLREREHVPTGQASSLPGHRQAGSLKHADFITSGNIDRSMIRPGNVRFLGRTYERPVLALDSPALTERQRKLFAAEKIVVAGLSQRLEAAWDDRGLALGVQVFALSGVMIDPQYLLALVNSKLLSYLFRTRFAAKRLAGDYMAINKGQLARLPIAVPRRTSVSLVQQLGQPGRSSYDDARIDAQVYQLYRLTKAEIATVEAHFANLGRRAA